MLVSPARTPPGRRYEQRNEGVITMIATNLTARHRSMLRAIAEGRGQLRSGTLAVDGLWCDFTATTDLVGHKLVQPAFPVSAGAAAPAILTHAGHATLAALTV
jgi:hypothetical protein